MSETDREVALDGMDKLVKVCASATRPETTGERRLDIRGELS